MPGLPGRLLSSQGLWKLVGRKVAGYKLQSFVSSSEKDNLGCHLDHGTEKTRHLS